MWVTAYSGEAADLAAVAVADYPAAAAADPGLIQQDRVFGVDRSAQGGRLPGAGWSDRSDRGPFVSRSSPARSTAPGRRRGVTGSAAVSTSLVLTLALQSAVPPFATDMYTPAFPRVTADLDTSASLVGLTLTTFFLGMALGQLLGGPLSDQRGRRMPIIVGGLICTLGAVGCAVAPSIGFLIVFRVVQGFGGGVAAVVARAVVVDVAKGDLLAKVMSIMMALGGLAPMVAPVVGGAVLTARRNLADGVLVPGRLRAADGDHRHRVRARVAAAGASPRRRPAPVRVGSEPGAADPAVRRLRADRGVVRLHDDGLHRELLLRAAGDEGPAAHAVRAVLRLTALTQVLLSIVNARIVGRFRPRTLIGFGLTLAALAVAALTVGVLALGTPLLLTCAGFLVLMAAQAFVFGNASALAAGQARHVAGAASAVLGVAQAVAMADAAPLASSGGGVTAEPMIWVMIAGVAGSLFAYLVLARPSGDDTIEPSPTN